MNKIIRYSLVLMLVSACSHEKEPTRAPDLFKAEEYNMVLKKTKLHELEIINGAASDSLSIVSRLVEFLEAKGRGKLEYQVLTRGSDEIVPGVKLKIEDFEGCEDLRDVLDFIVQRNAWTFRMRDGVLELRQYF